MFSLKEKRKQVKMHTVFIMFSCTAAADISLATGNHMAQLKIKGWGNRFCLLSKRKCKVTWTRNRFIKS